MAIKDFVVNSGITTAGPITLPSNPINPLEAATKQYVDNRQVTITNGGTGATTATQALINLGAAPLISPIFAGTPLAPTPTSGDISTKIATTEFVKVAISGVQGGAVATADKWTNARTFTFSGDATGSLLNIDGTANASATLTLSTANSTPGTYGNTTSFPVVTVNSKGLVTSITLQAMSTSNIAEGTNLFFTNARAIAAAPVQTVFGRTGTVTLSSSDVVTALGYTPINSSTLAAANGIATLDSTGKLNVNQVPAIAISDTFVIASDAAMLALVAQTGDVAIRTDLNKSYILKGSVATVLANWQELMTPLSAVQSVNGKGGVVTLTTTDITEGTNLYYTSARAQGAISVAGTGLTYANGVITISSTALNTASSIVARDASGNFTAGTITATLVGSASTAVRLTTARTINGVLFDGTSNISILDTTRLALDGSTSMTGTLTLAPSKLFESAGLSALNANNSDIVGLNGLYFQDASDSSGEGINFYRDASHWDTLFMLNGVLSIQRNRANNGVGTSDTVLHSGNYTTYSPSLTGSGATGTWSIGVTGNAATATKLAAPVTIGGVSFDGSANIALSTSNVSEGSNLYFTTARAQAAISASPTFTGNMKVSVSTIVSTGTTQSTGTAITTDVTVISSVDANTGVVLPTAQAGMKVIIINAGTNDVNVYPFASDIIDALTVNVPYLLGAGARLEFVATSNTQWYSMSAVFA